VGGKLPLDAISICVTLFPDPYHLVKELISAIMQWPSC
jgi:hypothetical protein